jgi:hypothetical protein
MKNKVLGVIIAVIVGGMGGSLFYQHQFGNSSVESVSDVRSDLSSEDEALLAKLQPFIECINRTDSSLHQNVEAYRETLKTASKYASPNHKPDQFENFKFNFINFKVSSNEQNNEVSLSCAAGLEKAVAEPPASPELDRIGKEYAATLRQLIPIFNQIDQYYEQKDFKDDRFKLGRVLDEQVTPLLQRLFSLSDPLRQEVSKQNDTLHQHQLDAAVKAGRQNFVWHTKNFMHQARRGMDALNSLEKVDETSLAAIEKPIQEAFDAAEAYGVAHPNEKEGYGNNPLWYSMKPTASLFLKYLKNLRRDVGQHSPQKDVESDAKIMNETFNNMVSNYNSFNNVYSN